MKIGSLFSGYGGLDLGVSQVLDAQPAWFSEIEKAPSQILAHHWPDVPNLGDITKVDWADVEPVDILTGGFPCQDVSHAGRRAGLIRDGEGKTRSGLWGEMLRAITELKPRLVIAENVRGLLSAKADSDMEPCTWCVGDDDTAHMRALGAVLADLADAGYDTAWTGLLAADIGAPHNRFRVFIAAWPRNATHSAFDGREQRRPQPARVERRPDVALGSNANELKLPTPRATRGGSATETVALLPTPVSSDGNGPGAHGDGGADLRTTVTLLPTPAVNDMGRAYTPDEWDEWTARMKQAHNNGNGHGKSLEIEAQRLSGEANDPISTEDCTCQEVPGVQNVDEAQEVQRQARRFHPVHEQKDLLETMRQHSHGSSGEYPQVESAASNPAGSVRTMPCGKRSACSPSRPERNQQQSRESTGAVRIMPPQTPLGGRPPGASGGCGAGTGYGCSAWGKYAPAIHRWEISLGRLAPPPTEPTPSGKSRLSARAVEFMMGLPAGHVADVPGLSRVAQLKALGNGVVPQQAAAALVDLLTIRQEVAA